MAQPAERHVGDPLESECPDWSVDCVLTELAGAFATEEVRERRFLAGGLMNVNWKSRARAIDDS
ncbi:hypothetical protein [Streptomyces sp. NPDC005476]|uniref:hypothetical protein n=1 Tax=Streptomyces sp. NPDC005476 TaxID=3156882 RepID=UPI00345522A0